MGCAALRRLVRQWTLVVKPFCVANLLDASWNIGTPARCAPRCNVMRRLAT
jgi:hypothetical protein